MYEPKRLLPDYTDRLATEAGTSVGALDVRLWDEYQDLISLRPIILIISQMVEYKIPKKAILSAT